MIQQISKYIKKKYEYCEHLQKKYLLQKNIANFSYLERKIYGKSVAVLQFKNNLILKQYDKNPYMLNKMQFLWSHFC